MAAISESIVRWMTEADAATPANDPSAAVDQEAVPTTVELFSAAGKARRLHDIHKEILVVVLRHYRGRVSQAARDLGIGRSTLYRKVSDFELDRGLQSRVIIR